MFYVSEIQTTLPVNYRTRLQRLVYETLNKLNISFERVDTDEAITMDDCTVINQKLNMNMVKTLFLCNRQQTNFYLFITKGDKAFSSKDFSTALGISRVSFAPAEKMEKILGTQIGAATVFSALIDTYNKVNVVIDKDVLEEEWYGCSDSTTVGYMKIRTDKIVNDFLTFANHNPSIIEI